MVKQIEAKFAIAPVLHHAIDCGIRQVAVAAIGGYQRYLPPHKRFACAHRVLHCGESCSQYVKRAIAQQGLSDALPLARQRFQACHAANLSLKAARASSSAGNAEEKRRRRQNDWYCGCEDVTCDPLPYGDCRGNRRDDCTPDCDFGDNCDFGCCDVGDYSPDIDCGSCDCG